MSLLEDVFLQDEAGEAQDLERVIEGDEFEERQHPDDSDDNSVRGDDEAEEDKRRVDPGQTKQPRIIRNPRFVLNPARLTGPRGIKIIPEHFKDFKFKGKGHEKEDLDMVLKKLEHWAYRLYPKFKFEDCLKKIETLGKKRQVMVHIHKIRNDQITSEETVVQQDSSDDEMPSAPPQEEDEFDKLLQQQIDLARSTPGPSSAKKHGFTTPGSEDIGTPIVKDIMPKQTSTPSLNDEQRERMLRNRRLAEERRMAKLKQNNSDVCATTVANNDGTVDLTDIVGNNTKKKQTKSNIIDSSDEEVEANSSMAVDIHNGDSSDDKIVDLTEIVAHIDGNQRKYMSNPINSSDDEVEGNSSMAVDIHNGDSDDDEEVKGNNSMAVDIHNGDSNDDKVVDLTEIVANTEGTQRKHMSGPINGRDEEVDLTKENHKTPEFDTVANGVIDEDKYVDLTDIDTNNSAHRQNKQESNLMGNSEDEEVVLTTEKLPKTYENKTKRVKFTENLAETIEDLNNSNEIDTDSSDDDCNLTTVNQSVTVDIHKSTAGDQENTNSLVYYDDDEVIDGEIKKETNDKSVEKGTRKSMEGSKKEKVSNKENITNNIPKENIVEKAILLENDVMDVDFSDDF